LAEKLDKTSLDFDTQCSDKDLTYAVLRELQTHGKKHKLEKFEIPGGVTMVKEIWDPESGLVTAAFKLKRRPLQVSKPPSFINSCSISHILDNEFFCLGRLGSFGKKIRATFEGGVFNYLWSLTKN
jgi:hypothetical protein